MVTVDFLAGAIFTRSAMTEGTKFPTVDFDCDDHEVDLDDWWAFWDSSRCWLAEQGYTLYENGYHWGDEYCGDLTFVAPKFPTADKVEYPFAFSGGEPCPVPPLSARPVVRPVSRSIFHKR
jgi:hypothetical protein